MHVSGGTAIEVVRIGAASGVTGTVDAIAGWSAAANNRLAGTVHFGSMSSVNVAPVLESAVDGAISHGTQTGRSMHEAAQMRYTMPRRTEKCK